MERIEIKTLFKDVSPYLEGEVTVCGWIKTMRNSKALSFIELNDGSCFRNLQVIMEADKAVSYTHLDVYKRQG